MAREKRSEGFLQSGNGPLQRAGQGPQCLDIVILGVCVFIGGVALIMPEKFFKRQLYGSTPA